MRKKRGHMKKTTKLLGAFLALALVFGYLFFDQKSNEKKGSKEITIEIVVDGTQIKQFTEYTDTTTLADFLKELQDNNQLELTYETTSWGMYIKSMEGYDEQPAQGKYWTHNSTNNEQCVKNNFCDGADSLNIGDGDFFTFTLEAYE